MNDLARTLAFAFRRKGVEAMPGAELRLLLAYDLRWFAPEDAKRVVARGIEVGLLREDGDALRPAFNPAEVEIPLNFRPSTHVIEDEAPVIPSAPAPRAAVNEAIERAAEDERRKRGLLISLDAARLIVRRRNGEDVAAEAAALEARRLAGEHR